MISELYSKSVSSETRKIVTALIVAVFGLSYENGVFLIKNNLFLKFALSLFFLHLLLDMCHYIYGLRLKRMGKDNNEIANKVYYLFLAKLIAAMIGLVFCALEVLGI
ncbi:MAG: hypothetical protein JXR50_00660 [Prolixibacteraceae bacterium]|nr:hypothetical protein [Prolixibacteraceae bacterium]MBN2648232.1 hypothetical protein [Prolixibacteraceae bacterium]